MLVLFGGDRQDHRELADAEFHDLVASSTHRSSESRIHLADTVQM